MTILNRILEAKRAELETEKVHFPLRRLIEMASSAPPPHPFSAALKRKTPLNVIAEIKRASPSKGEIRANAQPGDLARAYAAADAAALSVLTDARFFLGSPANLEEARSAVGLPILRKDFLFDEFQIYRSRALGADAVLLIARILEPKLLTTLIGVSRSLNMEALVEVHSEEDLRKALDCGASLVGVNNRDLDTLAVSLETSLRLAPLLPEGVIKVSESGMESHADLERLAAAGFDAFLIGERLMREDDPGATLKSLILGNGA